MKDETLRLNRFVKCTMTNTPKAYVKQTKFPKISTL